MSASFETPILFMFFNRREEALQVLERIRAAEPRRLFLSADGPRANKNGEAERCEEVRGEILTRIDWPCEIATRFSSENQGCKRAISSAISWFFDEVEEGIIFEDDCVPSQSFFPYAQTLLKEYRDEKRVSHIGAFNCQKGTIRGPASYYFSRYFHVWGWATWRRAWEGYSLDMEDYEAFIDEGWLDRLFPNPVLASYWKGSFDAAHRGEIDTWDYQWVYHNLKNDRLAITPNANLVHNIGFNERGTHTTGDDKEISENVTGVLDSDRIAHPRFMIVDSQADLFTYEDHCKVVLNPRVRRPVYDFLAKPWRFVRRVARNAVKLAGIRI